MTFLPIVERELRVQARQRRTHRLRLAGAVVAIAFVGLMLIVNEGFSVTGSPGHFLFMVLAWLAFFYCFVTGAGHTVDCLSAEKREGTLGLLFLTDLKGYDVVLGKLLATSLNNFYSLIAIFPPLAITFCLGGVMAGEFWRVVLVLMNALFFSLAAGIFISALSRDEQRAWAGVTALLLVTGALPCSVFLAAYDARYAVASEFFWKGLVVMYGLGWLMLGLASVILPRAWQDQEVADSSPGRRGLGVLPAIGAGLGRIAAEVRRRIGARRWVRNPPPHLPPSFRTSARQIGGYGREAILAVNPVLWLAARQTGSLEVYLWVVVAIAGVAGGLTAVVARGDAELMWGVFGCGVGLHYLLAVWAAFQASFVFAQARSSGTLELLLATPLSASQIMDGYFLGLRRIFARPVGALLMVEGVISVAQIFLLGRQNSNGQWLGLPMLALVGFSMVAFISDLFAVGRIGMWMGLSSKSASRAFGKTVLYVLVLPLFSVCCSFVVPLIWLLKNAILMNYGQEQLRRHFRQVLTEGWPARKPAGRLPSVVDGK